ncbi:hypothetical protein C7S17_5359 [Burkholderia thailandensis]|nr:hypothetical protein [Burkholderia thailandensis]
MNDAKPRFAHPDERRAGRKSNGKTNGRAAASASAANVVFIARSP